MIRVYLDEGVSHDLRQHRTLGRFSIQTAVYMGWNGLPNGEWMTHAHQEGFDVVVTTDQSIPAQQNLLRYRFGTVILSSPDFALSDANMTDIARAIDTVQPHTSIFVEID